MDPTMASAARPRTGNGPSPSYGRAGGESFTSEARRTPATPATSKATHDKRSYDHEQRSTRTGSNGAHHDGRSASAGPTKTRMVVLAPPGNSGNEPFWVEVPEAGGALLLVYPGESKESVAERRAKAIDRHREDERNQYLVDAWVAKIREAHRKQQEAEARKVPTLAVEPRINPSAVEPHSEAEHPIDKLASPSKTGPPLRDGALRSENGHKEGESTDKEKVGDPVSVEPRAGPVAVEPQVDASVLDSSPRFMESLGQRVAERGHGATIQRARQRKEAREFMDRVEREQKSGVSFRGFNPSEMVPPPEIVSSDERLERPDDLSKTGCSSHEELLRSENRSGDPPPGALDPSVSEMIEEAERQLARELREIEEIEPKKEYLPTSPSESGPATRASIRALDKKIGKAIDAIRAAEKMTTRVRVSDKKVKRLQVPHSRRRKRRQSRRGQRHNRNNATAIHWRDSLGRRSEKIRRRRTVFKIDLGKWWKAATDEAEEERAHHHRMKGLP